MQMRLHRSEREVERARDLLVAELVQVTEKEGRAIARREDADGGEDLADRLASHGKGLRVILRRLGDLREFRDRMLVRVPALDVVQARVRGDTQEPRRERQRGIVLVERAVRTDEGLLRAVVRGVPVTRDPQREVVQPASVPFDDLGEGVAVARQAGLDDLLVAPQPCLLETAPTASFSIPAAGAAGFRRLL